MSWLFYGALGFLMTHELDAIDKKEWRLLPGLCWLDDVWGYRMFVWLHVPLFGWVLSLADHPTFRLGMSAFCVVHLFLHLLLRKHPSHLFDDWWSWGLIVGAGVCGAGFILHALH